MATKTAAAMQAAVADMHSAVAKLNNDVPAASAKVRLATDAAINESERLAREARRTRSSPGMPAVVPPTPGAQRPEGDLTRKFKALR